MERISQPRDSHLFTVRLWEEAAGEGCTEWRGKVQHILSGEVRYFRDWSTLITFLEAILTDETAMHGEGSSCRATLDGDPGAPEGQKL